MKEIKFDKNIFVNKNGGFLVLTMVLLVSAVVLVISAGVFLRSINENIETADSEFSLRALSNVMACGEYTLGQMMGSTTSTTTTAENWSYAGDEILNIPLPDGSDTCYIYPVEDGDLGSKIIKASSTVSSFTKKLLIEVATNTPNIILNSWTEVADFE